MFTFYRLHTAYSKLGATPSPITGQPRYFSIATRSPARVDFVLQPHCPDLFAASLRRENPAIVVYYA